MARDSTPHIVSLVRCSEGVSSDACNTPWCPKHGSFASQADYLKAKGKSRG